MPASRPARLALGAALAIAAAVAIAVVAGGDDQPTEADTATGPPAVGAADSPRPNIVVLMADDLGLAGFERGLPRTRRLLGARGTELVEAIVSTPLCCPSRATFLSGRYGHNNGVLANDPGYPLLDRKREVLPVRLARAGYRTALVGKFMNGFERTARGGALRPAPGWEEWVEMRRTFSYYDYALNEGGEIEQYGDERGDYLTDVLTDHAVKVIGRAAADGEPLFLWLSWWAPHPENSGLSEGPCRGSAIPADRDPGRFAEQRLPDRPSIDEADVSDKPRFVRRKRDLRPGDRNAARLSFRCRLASLEAVDRGVERVVAALAAAGELEETAIVFTSDNGFLHLEHRFPDGKGLPYEEAVRVPLLIDLPSRLGPQPKRSAAPVSNVDLAPTLLELAGVKACPRVARCAPLDGLSLLPLLRRRERARGPDRALLIEAAEGKPCPFAAVRTARWLYAEHEGVAGERLCPAGGERELYDLSADPAQLDNLLAPAGPSPPSRIRRRLSATLERLRDCAGARPGARLGGRPSCTVPAARAEGAGAVSR